MKVYRKLPVFFFLLISVPAFAATFIVGQDSAMIKGADAIVIGVVQTSEPTRRGHALWTRSTVLVEDAIAGQIQDGALVDILEPGGVTDDVSMLLHGVPQYTPGERVLLFLSNRSGFWRTKTLTLGKFTFKRDQLGRNLLLRDRDGICGWDSDFTPHRERARLTESFLAYVRDTVSGLTPEPDYEVSYDDVCLVDSTNSLIAQPEAAADYMFCSCRWNTFPTTNMFVTSGTQTGMSDSLGAVDRGAGAWNNDSQSNVSYARGGTTSNTMRACDDSSVVIFNDPNDEIDGTWPPPPGESLAVGLGGPCFTNSNPAFGGHEFQGVNFGTSNEGDVVLQDGVSEASGISQSVFDSIVAHELGHTLGFRHSDQGSPFAANALMAASANNGPGSATLLSWDQDAVRAVYPSGGACTAVSIGSHPQSTSVNKGSSTTLSVSPSGTSPFTYQWYQGTSGTTTDPVGTNSSSFNTGSLTAATSYWVRVTNCAGAETADSNTATVTVTCDFSFSPHPQSVAIESGTSTLLSVGTNPTPGSGGATYSYQWFEGSSGTTTTPVGSNQASFQTPTLTSETSYWVRVTRTDCEPDVVKNSNTATVSICSPVQITQQPQDASVQSGSGTTLSVVATGSAPITYQWYRNIGGNTFQAIFNARSATLNTGTLTSTQRYLVVVSNGCGEVQSDVATVTVTTSCTPPSITVQPAGVAIDQGQSATLSVSATGTSLSYQWFQGNMPDQTKPVGTGSPSFNTGSLSTTTSYWVRVTNPCGAVNSQTATVTVTPCVPATISVQPASVEITVGQTTTLTVTASGVNVQYQWYEGESGDFSKPVGTNAPSFTTPPLTTTTKYWVLVKTACGGAGSQTATVTVKPPCPAGRLCSLNGRFQLSLAVRDHRTNKTGTGTPLQQNDLFGFFSLPEFTGDPNNPEVFVKMLDGQLINGNFWVFYGGLTDLEYTLTVTDKTAGTSKTYFKSGGTSNGGFDTGSGVIPESCVGEVDGTPAGTEAPTICGAGSDRLCLNSGRFRVSLSARDPRTGNTATGLSIPQQDIFGYFALPGLTNDPSNPEVFVKVVDGRIINNFFWVFFSGLTDFEYTLTVVDTFTGVRKTYSKDGGSACGFFDTNAF